MYICQIHIHINTQLYICGFPKCGAPKISSDQTRIQPGALELLEDVLTRPRFAFSARGRAVEYDPARQFIGPFIVLNGKKHQLNGS